MANTPANAGSSGEQAPLSAAAPRRHAAALPPDPAPSRAPAPSTPATRAKAPSTTSAAPNFLGWALYLLVLAGVATGLFIACQGSRSAARGTAVMGCSLLAAGLARLVLPQRYAGLLSSRRKASDVLAFAALGAGVLAIALMLP
jgi:hypothetical protein